MMVVGVSKIEVFLPESHSLKEKRQATRKIVERTKGKFNIAIMEIDRSNLWQRASIGFALVGAGRDSVLEAMEHVYDFVESMYIGNIIDTKSEIMVIGDEV
jgi:uncharacterized protein YlxP (DUF503 family)